MKNWWLLMVVCCLSCSSPKSYIKAENALDAGREFLDGCLKGEFNKANFYMLQDASNITYLEEAKKKYYQTPEHDRIQYQQASITIQEITELTENITIINYQNSYDKIGRKIKVVKADNDAWLVDFKYTFSPNL